MFFNLDGDVGKLSRNLLADVELVRFGYFCKGISPLVKSNLSDREKKALQSLKTKGPYFPDLQEMIDAHQQVRGGTQDGKVSVGKPNIANQGKYDRDHFWIIFNLCHNMADAFPKIYPRIDLHEMAGLELKKVLPPLFDIG